MDILIYGAGAVGCYLGGHLALGGHRVTLLARGEMAAALASQGLTIRTAKGDTLQVVGLRVVTSPQEAFASSDYAWLAFTMKSYDTVAAIHELEAATKEPPPVLCMQNGVGNEASLASALGPERVVSGTLTTPVSVAAPGVIVEEKVRGVALAFDSPAAPGVIAAFERTRLALRVVRRADSLKWSKLLLNQLGNATSAILDMPPGDIFAHPALFAIERAALLETLRVMRANGIPPVNLPGVPAATLAFLVRALPPALLQQFLTPLIRRGRGNKMPTLYLDKARARRKSEVIWLNGAVARAGEDANVPAPVNHALALTLMDILEGRAGPQQFHQSPDTLVAAVRVATQGGFLQARRR